MKRAQAVGLGVLVAALAATLWWFAFRGGDEEDLFEPPKPEVVTDGPIAAPLDALGQARLEHDEPYTSFGAFEKEFLALRNELPNETKLAEDNMRKVYWELVDVDYKDATMDEVIEDLNRQLKHTGVKIFTTKNGDMDGARFTL